MINRRTLITAAALSPLAAQAQGIAGRRLPVELADDARDLPGLAVFGPKDAAATLIEFTDYNCGYCRRSALDLRALLEQDPSLRVAIAHYPILGGASVSAATIAHAAYRARGPVPFMDLHLALFRLQGRVDAERVLSIASQMGYDRAALSADASSREVRLAVDTTVRYGENIGLRGTPSFLAGTDAFFGYISLADKLKLTRNLAECGRGVCG
jgi:protein-disulfide isomerase